MRTYLLVLRSKGVAQVTASQLAARLPLAMIELAILIHVSTRTGSYGLAGLVLGVFSVAEAASGPVGGRLLGMWGVRPVLGVTTVICASAILGLAVVPVAPVPLCFLAVVAGLAVPPVMPAVRAFYPSLVGPELVNELFVLDTSSQEILWMIGPTLAAVLASSVSSAAPLILASITMVAGGAWLVAVPELRSFRTERSTAAFGRVLVQGPVLLGVSVSLLLVATFCALQVGILVRTGHGSAISGIIIAAGALGSLLGGVLLGHRVSGRGSVLMLTVWVLLCVILAAVAPENVTLLGAVLCAGMGFAPAMAAIYAAVSARLRRLDVPEAFGWLGTGTLAGAAIGTALAGAVSDVMGPGGAFGVTILFAAGACLTMASARRRPGASAEREHDTESE